MNILKNVGSIFTDTYLHYKNVPKETVLERSIAEITKLRKGRSDEIERKEQNINNELVHFPHLYLYQHLFLCSLIVSLFFEITILVCSLFLLWKQFCFTGHQNPSSMYKKLSETKGALNEFWVDSIKKVLTKLQRIIDYAPKDDVFKNEEDEKAIDIFERILYFNQLNQSGQGLKY